VVVLYANAAPAASVARKVNEETGS
jgi:hypothetical protein